MAGVSAEMERELARRAALLGPSLSTHYRTPIIVKRGPSLSRRARAPRRACCGAMTAARLVAGATGRGTFLFDENDQPLLDLVNNPACLGHCHKAVADAAARQMHVLNTNTRYIYPEITDYAEALTATLPAELSVCFFVNSGSEANDLALRMARTHTGGEGVVCVEGAYHGHTADLIRVSPYKYNGAGGFPPPATTEQIPLFDPLRGPHRLAPDVADAYASEVDAAFHRLRARGVRPAAFVCEGILTTAGYIPPPPGPPRPRPSLTDPALRARILCALGEGLRI